MYDLLPFVTIIVCSVLVIVIVVRKFPALASLDVSTIQAEKEVKFKEQIISNRLKRNYYKWWNKFVKICAPVGRGLSGGYSWLHERLVVLKSKYKNEENLSAEDTKNIVDRLFLDYELFRKKEEDAEAEKKLIAIIGLDSKNIKAFKALGALYLERKSLNEAVETFSHLLKILDNEEEELSRFGQTNRDESLIKQKANDIEMERGFAYEEIAQAYELSGDFDRAREYLEKSLAIEPNSPRRLDTLLSICIMRKDKAGALNAYDRLAGANPENQKLEDFKARIEEIS